MQPEDFKQSIYEAFLIPRKEIEKQISSQNAVIGFILGCFISWWDYFIMRHYFIIYLDNIDVALDYPC